ncbi:hypothetical protein [Pedobacter sp. SYSU D00535]|uniref:hypothetical protein n=1 Tax=Pedobacter sp. SYSU D00535 TaxID=2810308 RepID=UPI001A959DAB|nr:hypothetical protein [Pedobacter sp. SYSU D00535]
MNLRLLTAAVFISSLSACSSLYMPNVPNTPMLSAPGELHASAHISLRGNASFNTAYAVSNHLGVIANGSMMNNQRDRKDFKHNLIEAGAGYFSTFGPANNRILEIYGGLGRGSSERIYKERDMQGALTYDRFETSFNKLFFQVNYSSKRKRDLRIFGGNFPLNYGTALRASHVSMREFTRNDVAQDLEENIFLEPVFFTRMSVSNSVQIQYTSGSNFGLFNRKFLTAGNSVFTIGLVINVGGRNLNSTGSPR